MRNATFGQRQTGAALVVGLVLLVVISVLAISSINTATTELAMARNDMNYENAFQAAETGLENAIAQGRFDTLANANITDIITSNESVTAVIQFEDATFVPDRAFSMGGGASAYHFVATATAASKRAGNTGGATDRDATAVHSQAFYVVGPAAPSL